MSIRPIWSVRPSAHLPKCPFGQVSVCQVSVGQVSVGQVSVGLVSVCQVSLGKVSVCQVTVWSVRRSSVSLPSVCRQSVCLPSVRRPSVSSPSVSRPCVSRQSVSRQSVSRPSVSRPSVRRPSASRPSVSRKSVSLLKCQSAKCQSAKCPSAKCQSAKWPSVPESSDREPLRLQSVYLNMSYIALITLHIETKIREFYIVLRILWNLFHWIVYYIFSAFFCISAPIFNITKYLISSSIACWSSKFNYPKNKWNSHFFYDFENCNWKIINNMTSVSTLSLAVIVYFLILLLY